MHPEGLRGPGRVVGNPWSGELGEWAEIPRPAWCPEDAPLLRGGKRETDSHGQSADWPWNDKERERREE